MVENIVDLINEDVLTGHILSDIMATNYNFDSISKEIKKKLNDFKSVNDHDVMSVFLVPPEEKKKEETPDEKKKRIGLPNEDIESLLKEFKCDDAILKIKEHDIDKEQFWELEEEDFEKLLEIKIFGRRKKLVEKLKQLKEDHHKEMEELKKLEDEVDKSGVVDLLKRQSSIINAK